MHDLFYGNISYYKTTRLHTNGAVGLCIRYYNAKIKKTNNARCLGNKSNAYLVNTTEIIVCLIYSRSKSPRRTVCMPYRESFFSINPFMRSVP